MLRKEMGTFLSNIFSDYRYRIILSILISKFKIFYYFGVLINAFDFVHFSFFFFLFLSIYTPDVLVLSKAFIGIVLQQFWITRTGLLAVFNSTRCSRALLATRPRSILHFKGAYIYLLVWRLVSRWKSNKSIFI